MSSPNILLLCLIFFFFLSISTISCSSLPLSTIAISRIGNRTLVCALVPSVTSRSDYDLNCTIFPSGKTKNYPSGAVSFSAIAGGDGFLCALGSPPSSANISVMVWWDFAHNPHNNSIPDAKRVYLGPTVAALSAGDAHVCGLTGDSRSLDCWRWRHLTVPDVNVTSIAVGGDFVCGLFSTGGIRCFGNNIGVVGHEPAGNYTAVAAGTSHACGVSVDDDLVCWGAAGVPNVAKNVMPIDSLALGRNRTCALYVNGTVLCWGKNVKLPEDVAGSQFIAIEARGDAFCGVLMVNYSLVCWGSEVFHQQNVVFSAVLPGNCSPLRSCPCGVVPGSGIMCANNGAICRNTCNRSSNRLNVATPPSPPSAGRDQTRGHKNKRRFIFILAGSIGLGVATVIAICFLYFVLGYKKRRVHDSARLNVRTQGNATIVQAAARAGRESGGIDRHLRHFFSKGPGSLVEEFPIKLLLTITDGFSNKYKVGSGSFGSVYRAALEDGRVVAIKRAEPSSAASTSRARTPNGGNNPRRRRESAFISELALLSRVNHKNLVPLLGYCKDCSELILVYEFMSNGTLCDLLHNPDRQLGSPLSSWPARIQVALDAARGIDYLHTYAVPPIIHRDIKSSNILLDDNWTAKVSDFGLSLMNLDAADDDWSDGSVCTAGTVGYMDPEYYRLQHLTAKSDIYSFGVVLLEILSGSKVIQTYGESGSPKNVVDMVLPHIVADDIHCVLDKRLALPTPTEMEAVAFVCYLASDCVSTEGRNRPTITEVVNGLERALAACTPRPLSRSSTMGSR